MCDILTITNIVLGFLGPIVAVVIAICASRSSAKDTAKQIAAIETGTTNKIKAIEENTAREIESIKKLTRLQSEIATIQLDKELWEMRYRWRQNSNQIWDMIDSTGDILKNYNDPALLRMREQNLKERSLDYEQEFYMKQMKSLEGYLNRLNSIKKELDLE